MSAEKELQAKYGTLDRANAFERNHMIDYLNERMISFISEQSLLFIATADKGGKCDSSIRTGPKAFVKVLDSKTLVYPEYRGNGVLASLGNIAENPHIGLLFIDFQASRIGLHINGKASIVEQVDGYEDEYAERWVRVEVEEAYIHCSKHIPQFELLEAPRHWNSDDPEHKGGNFFDVAK